MLRVLAVCLTISWSLCMTEGVRAVGELNESLQKEKKKAIENFEKQSDRATDFATVVDTSFLKIVSEQKQFKELIEGRTALGELVGKMESMDLEQVDLNEVIEVLGDAMEYLQKVRRQWNDLVQFFDEIKKIIDQNIIADNLKPTLRLVSYCIQVDSQIDPVILKSTLRLVAYCIQVGNSARLYQIVSEKHITSKLRYVADRLTLDKVKAKQRKARFKHKFQELTNDVTKLNIKNLHTLSNEKQFEYK
ncbi:unnamed protein product, partial [Mesorhabditis belari]|uniref:Uncharacterized protein n=1 Tax=Mesorhabditis belari TaxID=2138241 RepID=A0AAF3FN78_9BILA